MICPELKRVLAFQLKEDAYLFQDFADFKLIQSSPLSSIESAPSAYTCPLLPANLPPLPFLQPPHSQSLPASRPPLPQSLQPLPLQGGHPPVFCRYPQHPPFQEWRDGQAG